MLHFPFYFQLDALEAILIWHTDDVGSSPDRFELLDPFSIACFHDRVGLLRFAESNNIEEIVDEDNPVLADIDAAQEWAISPTSSKDDCHNALGVWNMFIDLCATMPDKCSALKDEIDSASEVEQKLFFGSNLPSITPEGECYEPHWEAEDKQILRSVFANGAEALRRSINKSFGDELS